jgi:hypothetical protein
MLDLPSPRADLAGMNTVMAILSQLFWGVTVGALTGTAALIAKIFLFGGGLFGGGYAALNWRKLRERLRSRR